LICKLVCLLERAFGRGRQGCPAVRVTVGYGDDSAAMLALKDISLHNWQNNLNLGVGRTTRLRTPNAAAVPSTLRLSLRTRTAHFAFVAL
jgi:hypothetical protein